MITELLSLNSILFTVIIIISIAYILSLFGYIGNLNINSGGGNINISGSDIENELIAEAKESVEVDGVNIFVVNNPLGNVEIKPTAENKVSVTKKLYLPKSTPDEEKKRIRETFDQNLLKKNEAEIEISIPKMVVFSVLTVRIDLEITVPRTFNVKQLPGVNDITLEDIEGDVELENNVGNISLKRLKGNLVVNTNSGSIMGHDLKKITSLTTSAGNIAVSSVGIKDGDVKIVSQVGNVEVDINEIATNANCQIKSSTGEVSIMIDRQLKASLDASTDMGKLDVDPNIKVIAQKPSFMGGAIEAVVNEPGGKLKINSNTGGVKISLK